MSYWHAPVEATFLNPDSASASADIGAAAARAPDPALGAMIQTKDPD